MNKETILHKLSNNFNIQGLTPKQLPDAREKHAWIREPMVLLLLMALCLYFISGDRSRNVVK